MNFGLMQLVAYREHGLQTEHARLGTHSRRPRHVRGFLASSVGTIGSRLHFARGFGRGRRASVFGVMLLQSGRRVR